MNISGGGRLTFWAAAGPGQPDCHFFIKTGHCKFGEDCRFNHPPEKVSYDCEKVVSVYMYVTVPMAVRCLVAAPGES